VQCTNDKSGVIHLCPTKGQPCVPATTQECTKVVPADGYKNQESIFFGALTNVRLPPDAVERTPITPTSIELAVGEINAGSAGIPGAINGGRRPLVAVLCDGGGDLDALTRAADHVIGKIGVRALLMGSLNAANFTSIFLNKAVPNDVFVLTTDLNDPTFSALSPAQTKGLLWTNIGGLLDLADPYVPLLATTEQTVRAKKGIGAAVPLKVALVTTDAPDTIALAERIAQLIRFNGGKSAIENGSNFANISSPSGDPSHTAPILALKAFAPDIIIPVTFDEFEVTILPKYEAELEMNAFRPYYLTSAFITPNELLDRVEEIPGLEKRIAGVTDANPENLAPQDGFVFRYKQKFPNVQEAVTGVRAYDAAYILSFAFAANASRSTILGADLAATMPTFGSGTRYAVGPSVVGQAINRLASGATITVDGASGVLNFDESGSRTGEASVYCIKAAGASFDLVQDVVRYNIETKQLTGTFNCY